MRVCVGVRLHVRSYIGVFLSLLRVGLRVGEGAVQCTLA